MGQYADLFDDPSDKQRANANLRFGIEAQPDVVARDQNLAKRYGLPPGVIEQYRPDYEARAKIEDAAPVLDQSPALRGWLAADDTRAKIAHDDLGNMGAVEAAVKWLVSAPGAKSTLMGDLAASYHGAAQGTAGAFQALTATAAAPFDFLEGATGIGGNPLRRLNEGFGMIGTQAAADRKATSGKSETWLGGAVSGGVQSLGQNLAVLPMALLPGGQAAALTAMAGMAGGQTYQKDIAAGIGHWTALAHGTSDAVIEAGTEMLPMARLIGDVKAGTSLWKTMTHNAALEVPGEQVATALQDLNDWAVNNEGKTFGDYLRARPEAAAQTLIATLVGTGGNVAIMHGVQKAADRATGYERQAAQAEQRAEALGQLATLAEASKLRERDPEAFATFAQQLTDDAVPNLYVDPRALQQAGVDLAALARSLPSVAPQIGLAAATGGDLVIPTAEFLTHAPGQEFQQALIEHARTAEDAMSPAEARVYMQEHGDQLQGEIARVIDAKQGEDTFQAGRDQVRDEFQRQLDAVKRFTPDVNKSYATLLGDFYAVTAARLGTTPTELMQRYPLRVTAQEATGGNTLEQAGQSLYDWASNEESARRNSRLTDAILSGESADAIMRAAAAANASDSVLNLIAGELNRREGLALVERGDAARVDLPVKAGLEQDQRAGSAVASSDGAHWIASDHVGVSTPVAGKVDGQVDGQSVAVGVRRHDVASPRSPEARQSVETDEPFIPQFEPDDYVERIEPVHGVKDKEKYEALTSRMESTGRWIGRPVLGYRNASGDRFALTGSHRIAAARKAGVDIPVVWVSDEAEAFNDSTGDYLDDVVGTGDDRVLDFLEQAGDDRGAALMSAEVDQNYDEFVLNQGDKARGQIAFGQDITQSTSTLTLLKDADLSTFIHESGHFFLEVQADMASRAEARIADGEAVSDGEREIVADMNRLLAWFGVKATPEQSAIAEWHAMTLEQKRQHHEAFARGFERYAFEGKAPSLALQSLFQRFRAWLVNVYKSLKALNVELSDDVRGVMDRMLATTQQIQEAEAARSMGALFETPEQAGMTPEQFKAYHDLAVDATQQAIENLQARGLRDMQWLRNAHGRELKKLQQRAAGLRREVEREVRAEVMRQPVYRAWAFLTGKGDAIDQAQPAPRVKASGALDNSVDNIFVAIAKLGGLNRGEITQAWGIDPKERLESPVFGKPVTRRDGGLTIDAMTERLVEEGYLLADEHGKGDPREMEEAFDSQRRGVDQFSTWHDYTEQARAAMGDAPADTLPEHATHGKLDTAVLREMYGTQPEALWRKLSTLRMTSEASGIHPDVVAETFGFSSGDELAHALVDADPPRQVIEGLTDQRMLERHGELATPEGLQRAADMAVHTEARSRAIASEMAALDRAGQVREPVPGQRNTIDVLARVARDYAQVVVARIKVRDIRPGQYAAAEARAAKAAEKAFRAGDTATASNEKRNQLVQNAATKAAYAAQEEVDKARDYLQRMGKRPKSVDADYLDQIDALLERFDLKQTSLKALDKRKSLVQWAEAQREQGLEPDIPPELMSEALRKNWREMTIEELRGLRDTVQQIEHLGRLKNKLLTSQSQREFDAVRDEITDSIEEHAGKRRADTRTPATTLGKSLLAVRNFSAAHIKVATWARVFDGGKDGGPVWEYLIRTANAAGDFETTRRAQATEALTQILAPVLAAGKMGGKGKHFASIGRSMNREQVFAMALNTGNAGNLQRMLGGEGWTVAQIQPVLATLSGQDWRAVQAVWDHFETYRPEIGAKEKRVYGKEPNWVEPTPFDVTVDGQTLSLRGGYYPIKYDPLASNRAEQHSDAEDAKRQLQGAYTSATTRRGFTKERSAEVSGRPLLYSLAGVYSGVNDVVHDLAWHEWLIDANKILRSDKIDSAIRGYYGPEVVRQFKNWVKDVAAGEQGLQAELDGALGRLRHGVSIAGLGFNVMSAAMQPLGLTQSIVRVGAKWIGRGLSQYIASPAAATRRVNRASEFMAGRSRTRFRELNELRGQVEGQSKAREAIGTWAYFLMMRCQQMVDTPTWLGAYEKAISEGNDEARAVALADQAVIDAQGGGQTKDLSAIERGGPAQKLFTVFYSFMNTALNVGVGQTMTAAKTPKARAKLTADYLLLYSVPVVLGAILKDALTPGDAGDDDPEKLAKKLLGEQLGFLMGLMVVVREFGEAGKAALSLSDNQRGYSGPAGVRLIADTRTFAGQAAQGEFDDQFRKASINLLGDLFALPAAQVNRSITGAQALNEGKTQNPAALVFGYQEPR